MPISYWESLTDSELDTLTTPQLLEAHAEVSAAVAEIRDQLADRGARAQVPGAPQGELNWLAAARGAFSGKRGRLKKIAWRLKARGIEPPEMPAIAPAVPIAPKAEPKAAGRGAADVLADILEELYRWDIDPAQKLTALMREAESHRVTVA